MVVGGFRSLILFSIFIAAAIRSSDDNARTSTTLAVMRKGEPSQI